MIDFERIAAELLPQEPVVSAITMAELASGPHGTDDPNEQARRQDLLQRVESLTESLPFDAVAARAYGRVYAAKRSVGRKPREARAIDLFIASVALAHDLPLFTRNPEDFAHLQGVGLEVHAV